MKQRLFVTTIPILLTLFLNGASVAEAQAKLGFRGWAMRAGVTVDPDQFHAGIHINAGEFAPRVRFQPSFEIGFGNDRIVGDIHLDAFYMIRARGWRPYVGAGLGIALVDADHRDFDVGAGMNLVGGFEWGTHRSLILELRVGVGDIPDLKLTAGIGF
jgi:hypothetical protein